jgi:hypothetical protein
MRAEDQLPPAISMVIRTEYRAQRYSMGSLDPLLVGFEIRFGSLNFQATGNGYLMCITNRNELHSWWSTGPGPVPVTPGAGTPAPAQADAAGPSAPQCRRRSGLRSRQARMERRRATHVASQRDAPTGEMATAPMGEHAVPEPRFPYSMRNAAMAYASSTSTDVPRTRAVLVATSWRLGTSPPAPTTSPTTAPPAICHPPLRTGTRSGTSPACRTR